MKRGRALPVNPEEKPPFAVGDLVYMGRPWLERVSVRDLHAAYRKGEMDIVTVSKETAKRLRACKWAGALASIIAAFERARTTEAHDAALARLYDFGDVGKRLWVES